MERSTTDFHHVEILRTSTSEPTRGAGIYWTVVKDVTSYGRLFERKGNVILDLGNGLDYDKGLDGVFEVVLSVTFHRGKGATNPPDEILPISNLAKKEANYFSIDEDGSPGSQWVTLPSTAERATVEIYASGNAKEEFWYTNIPDSLKESYPDMLAKGPFREVSLSIDGIVAGYVFPFPVIFSGGIVPTAWRPMIAFGAYDQPTYEIDITPLLPLFAGRTVKFSLAVHGQGDSTMRSIYGNWFASGNVKVWRGEDNLHGSLLEYEHPPLLEQTIIHVDDKKKSATSLTTVTRQFKIVSEVNGQISTFQQDLQFTNRQHIAKSGGQQDVEQLIQGSYSNIWGNRTTYDNHSFPLKVSSDYSSDPHFGASIQLGYHRKTSTCQIDVVQKASGEVFLNEIGRVVNGTGQSEGRLEYQGDNGRRYERKVKTAGLKVVKDEEREWRWAL